MDEADYSSGAIFNQGPTIEITKFKLPAVTRPYLRLYSLRQ